VSSPVVLGVAIAPSRRSDPAAQHVARPRRRGRAGTRAKTAFRILRKTTRLWRLRHRHHEPQFPL